MSIKYYSVHMQLANFTIMIRIYVIAGKVIMQVKFISD